MEPSAANILEIGAVLCLASTAGLAARRAGMPAIVGYLATGVVVSPFTPGYTANHDQLQTLADIGVVLLLFEVGIEIDPLRLRRERGSLLWAAPLQVALTLGAGTGAGLVLGLGLRGAMVLGLAVAMSSSVVVVNITRSRRRTTDPDTEAALLAWSVLQDVTGVVVAMGLLASLGESSRPVWATVAGILAFVALAATAAWVLPMVLRRLRSEPDLFLIVSVASGLLLAGMGARLFEVPLALAAFVSGLAVGESSEADDARRQLLPFRDIFAVMFFVTIGSLIDPRGVPGSLGWLAVVAALLVVAKVGVIHGIARAGGLAGSGGAQLAVGLGQLGEFSFVLGSIGTSAGVVPSELYTALLLGVALSIAVSATAVRLIPARGSGSAGSAGVDQPPSITSPRGV